MRETQVLDFGFRREAEALNGGGAFAFGSRSEVLVWLVVGGGDQWLVDRQLESRAPAIASRERKVSIG